MSLWMLWRPGWFNSSQSLYRFIFIANSTTDFCPWDCAVLVHLSSQKNLWRMDLAEKQHSLKSHWQVGKSPILVHCPAMPIVDQHRGESNWGQKWVAAESNSKCHHAPNHVFCCDNSVLLSIFYRFDNGVKISHF